MPRVNACMPTPSTHPPPHLRMARHYHRQGVRGTSYTPVIGDMLCMARQYDSPTGMLELLEQHRERARKAPWPKASLIWRGPRPTLILWDLDVVRKVLDADSATFAKPTVLRRLLETQAGQGLFVVEGALWKAHRRIIAPAFSASHVKAVVPIMAELAAAAAHGWLARVDASSDGALTIDVAQPMSDLALRIVGRAAFGADIETVLPLFSSAGRVSPWSFALIFAMSLLPGE